MANISFNDKKYFENLFGMRSGCVLDFTNREFSDFVMSSIQIDIYKRYSGLSKAKILRAIMSEYDNRTVGKLLLELLEYKRIHCSIKDDEKEWFLKCAEIGHHLIGKVPQNKTKEANANKNGGMIKTNFDFDIYKNKLIDVTRISNPQARGYAFEKYLNEFFNANKLEARSSFRIVGEHIDGSFILDSEVYLLEAKWQDGYTKKDDLILFQEKVTNKSIYTRGLFISYSGYDKSNIDTFLKSKTSRIILMDGAELVNCLEKHIDFREFLESKHRLLAEEGECFQRMV